MILCPLQLLHPQKEGFEQTVSVFLFEWEMFDELGILSKEDVRHLAPLRRRHGGRDNKYIKCQTCKIKNASLW